MSVSRMVAPAPSRIVVFRSVLFPGLRLTADDVEPCPECEHLSPTEYERVRVLSGVECSCCRGYRLIHGMGVLGGYPAALVEDKQAGEIVEGRNYRGVSGPDSIGGSDQAGYDDTRHPPFFPPPAA